MTATDLGLVVVVVASIASVAAVLAATVALVRSARALRVTLAVVERDLEAARNAVASADAGARRADEAVIHAEELAGELESSSRLMRRFLVGPLVRVAAIVRGTGRAVGGLFGGRRRRRQRRADHRRRDNGVPPVATGVHSRRSSTT
jgi:hypothetical protein